MQKITNKIDWILLTRLIMSIGVGVVAYQNTDYTAGLFALFFGIYSFIAAKYKIGCGYGACGYTPSRIPNKESSEIDFIEIK